MTSSSSLYGSVTTQNSSSSNSTSLYGEAGTPIPDSSGNVIVRGDLYVLSGNILTTATTGNIFPANATTINLGLAATAVNIGAASGTTTVNNALTAGGTVTAPGADFGNITIGVATDNTITTTTGNLVLTSAGGEIDTDTTTILSTNSATFALLNSPTTVNAFQGATTLTMGAATGTTTIQNDLSVQGTGTFTGDVTATGADLGNITIGIADNQTITTTTGELRLSSTSGNIKLPSVTSINTDTTGSFGFLNQPTTINAFLDATTINIGETTGTTTINNNLVVGGTGTFTGDVTATGGDFGNITVGVATNNTIASTTGGLALTSFDGSIGLVGSGTLYTDQSTFLLLNSPTTVTAFDSATTLNLGETTGTTFIRNDVNVGGDLKVNGNNIKSNGGTTAITLSGADVTIADDLTITGNTVNLAQDTTFSYNENNDRALRPSVQSTTGNSSGFRVLAPNATTSAGSNLTVFGSDDIDNGEFLNLRATGSTTAPFSIRTGKYTAGVLGASGEEINFVDNTTTYASINPAGPTNSTDLTTKAYVDALPANITYTVDASTTTGGANFNLVGSDATTDTVKFANGTNVTVTATDANTITIAATDTNTTYDFNASSTTGGANLNLVGSDSTTDTVKLTNGGHITATYTSGTEVTLGSDATDANTANAIVSRDASGNFAASGATLGNITVGVADDQTITTTSGNLILDSVGGTLQLNDAAISSPVAQTWTVIDNTASALSIGATGKADMLKFVTTNGSEQLTTSAQFTGDSASLNRFIRTNNGTGSNAILEISRNRADAARAVDGGPWLGFAYVGTDNTQTTAVQNAIQSRYQTAGNHQLRFIQFAGDYAVPTVMGQVQRGNTFFNTTGGVANLFLSDTVARVGGTTTTITNSANTQTYASLGATSGVVNQDTFGIRNNAGTTTYATFASGGTDITGAGLSTITRTTVGTPTVVESRPSMNIQLIRSDQAGPTSGDGTGFRSRVGGSNGTIYTISDLGSNYSSTGDVQWALQLANGDQTTSTFSGLQTIKSKISETTIAAGTPSATPGASTVSTVATFGASGSSFGFVDFPVLLNRTTAGTPGVPNTKASYNIEARRSDQAGVTDGDAVGAGFRVGGTANYYWTSNQSSQYDSAGDHAFQIQAADGDRTAGAVWLNVLDARPSSTTIYAGTTSSGGGGSTSAKLTVDNTKITAAVPFKFPTYTAAASAAVTGAVGWQISISDSPTVGGRMAFWDTTNARWSYISDNSAV